MVRNAKKQPASMAKMYRHFAFVTIGVTALVGILADGEAQKSLESHIEKKAEKKRIAEADETSANREMVQRDPYKNVGSFGSANSPGSFGQGTETSNSNNYAVALPQERTKEPVWKQFGLTEKQWLALTPETRARFLKTQAAPAPLLVTSEQQSAAMRKMMERSREATGASASGNNDAPPDSEGF